MNYTVGLTPDGFRSNGTCIFGDLDFQSLEKEDISLKICGTPGAKGNIEDFVNCDAILSFGQMKFPKETVQVCPKLRHIARFGAGVDGIDLDSLKKSGVIVTNSPMGPVKPLASATLTLMLALSHRLIQKANSARSGRWNEERGNDTGPGLHGRKVGIFGYGNTGKELVHLLQPFDVSVATVGKPNRVYPKNIELKSSINELAEWCDILVITTSLNSDTFYSVDRHVLSQMSQDALIINVSRGDIIKQDDLVWALENKIISGAGLDVVSPEPLSSTHPLFRFDNVIITPHSLCWTENFFKSVNNDVNTAILDIKNKNYSEFQL